MSHGTRFIEEHSQKFEIFTKLAFQIGSILLKMRWV